MFARLTVWLVLVAGILGAGGAQAASFTPAQADYCRAKGGVVQVRAPEYGTNGGVPLVLAGTGGFCAFTSAQDGSSIYVLLSTLTTSQSTLAALAYYAETPQSGTCRGSPGSCYCSQVGGTDLFGGVNAAGGGWVLTTDKTDVLDTCIFPDLSSIDSYGLFYHSAGIVRGTDLSKVFAVFEPLLIGCLRVAPP